MKNEFQSVFDSIELPQDSQKNILDACKQRRHVKNFRVRYAGPIAAAVMFGVFVICSGTAYAAVNLYQAYMERMTVAEKEQILYEVQSGTDEARYFSRKLSDEENHRMESLKQAYQQGERFPKNIMPATDGSGREEEELRFYYDYVAGIYHLPEETLTDEQLLQIIDTIEKANYVLAQQPSQETSISNSEGVEWVEKSEQDAIRLFVSQVYRDLGYEGFEDKKLQIEYHAVSENFLARIQDKDINLYVVLAEGSTEDDYVVDMIRLSDGKKHQAVERTEEECLSKIIAQSMFVENVMLEHFLNGKELVKCEYAYYDKEMINYELLYEDAEGNRYLATVFFDDNVLKELSTIAVGEHNELFEPLEGYPVRERLY